MSDMKPGLWSRIIAFWLDAPWTDHLVPGSLREGRASEAMRAKLYAPAALFLFVVAPLVASPYFASGHTRGGLYTLFFVALAGSGYVVMRLTGSLALGTHLTCSGAWGACASGYLVLDGLYAPSNPSFALIPAFAFFFGGARSGLAWLAIVVATLGGLFALEWSGTIAPASIFSGELAATVQIINVFTVVFSVWLYVVTQQAVRDWLAARTKRQEERLGAVLRSAADAVVIFDDAGQIESANHAASVLLGDLEDAPAIARLAPRWIERGGRTLSISATEIGAASRQIVLIARDETERQRAIDEASRARDAALKSSRAKSRFLANMSHELRTPLNAVIGYAELISEEDFDEEFAHESDAIRAAGRHLLGIISDVLDVASIERGREQLRAAEVPIGEIVSGLVAAAAPAIAERGNRWSTRVDPKARGINLYTDARKVERIMASLIANANKFTEGGEVALEAGYDAEAEEAWFLVRDTGCGIEPGARATIWEGFTMGDDSETRRHGGVGLGLALARGLAELLGGRIELESQPGRGSTFRLFVPRTAPSEASTVEYDPGEEREALEVGA